MAHRQRFALGVVALLCAGLCPLVEGQGAGLAGKINEAIDKGVKYLKKYTEDGDSSMKRPGSWALRGWALLEAGVPGTDSTVKKLAAYVRKEVPTMDKVYDLSIALIFLDKLADPGDELLIESLAVRLIAGQGNRGGWTYFVDSPHQLEKARLTQLVSDMDTLRSQGLALRLRQRTPQEIVRDVTRQYATIAISQPDFGGDNSNTQFAMIALWVARRHGVPVTNNLRLVEKRYQVSQLGSGTWSYNFPTNEALKDDNRFTYPAMTCAGLLGLALGQGVQAKPRDLRGDPQVRRGLAVIAQALTKTPATQKDNFLYFLFSMERAAVVYDLKEIGGTDWYQWGARQLVDSQTSDGLWSGGFETEGADTCFALLFLKRANVARDLTDLLLDAPIRKAPLRKGTGQ